MLLGQDINEFYEVGPGRVLRGLLKRIDRKSRLPRRVLDPVKPSGCEAELRQPETFLSLTCRLPIRTHL